MAQTMTWIGLDVHARSVHVALVDAQTGELRRRRLGGGVEEVVRLLASGPPRSRNRRQSPLRDRLRDRQRSPARAMQLWAALTGHARS
jgi:hypothetical protein